MPKPEPLILPGALQHAIRRRASAGYPREVCGLLLGRSETAATVVERLAAARNRHPEPATRFDLHPEDFVAADRAGRAAGLEIVGVWHSHPDAPPEPSASDRAAALPGYAYVIVAVGEAGAGALRCWRLSSGSGKAALEEQPVRLAAGERGPA